MVFVFIHIQREHTRQRIYLKKIIRWALLYVELFQSKLARGFAAILSDVRGNYLKKQLVIYI